MLDTALGAILGLAAAISVIAAVVTFLVGVTLMPLRLRSRLLIESVVNYVYHVRQRDYANKGILAKGAKLKRYVRREAREFLEKSKPSWPYRHGWDGFSVWMLDCPPPFRDPHKLRAAIEAAWPDMKDLHDDLLSAFERFGPHLDKHCQRTKRLLAFFWSLVLVVALQISTIDLFNLFTLSDWANGLYFLPNDLNFSFEDGPHWDHLAGMLLTVILATLLSGVFQRWMIRVSSYPGSQGKRLFPNAGTLMAASDKQPAMAGESVCEPTIGRKGQAVRAISFAGGGFDTIMQIGVTHALVVIQGRAPDAVVGISAGALNAAALAEVLQAGDEREEQFCRDNLRTAAAFSPDGARIVSGSDDDTVRVWDAASGAERLVLRGHEDWVNAAVFSPDGARIVSGSGDDTVRVWDAASGEELLVLRGHQAGVNAVAFSPDGARIVSGSRGDGTVRVWDAASGAGLIVLRRPGGDVDAAAFSPDGARIMSGSRGDGTVRVWDAASGAERLVLRGHEDWVNAAVFSPDGARIVSGSGDDTVRVWDAASGEELLVLRGHQAGVNAVAFSPDGARIVSGSRGDGTVRVWDAASGAGLIVLRRPGGDVDAAAFSPDGARIMSGSRGDGTVRVWDAASGAELFVLRGQEAGGNAVAFSPDGGRIVSGSDGGTVRVWDAASGAELLVLQGHQAGVNAVAFSPDGARIVSGSDDDTVRVWDAASGAERLVLRGHKDWVNAAVFSPDGARIVSGSGDDTVRVWDAASGEELLVLHGHEWPVENAEEDQDSAKGSRDKGWERAARQWRSLSHQKKADLQEIRLLARVAKLRHFIEAAQRAPEEILDALMPDIFQVDSNKPLRPLEEPRFAEQERKERTEAATMRSGMIRLYNNLLDVHFSLGSITLFARRFLGLKALPEVFATRLGKSASSARAQRGSGNYEDEWKGPRAALSILFKSLRAKWHGSVEFARNYPIGYTEAARLWILLGSNLYRASPLVATLAMALLVRRRGGRPQAAGELIFQFTEWLALRKRVRDGLVFCILLPLMLLIGLIVLVFGVLAVGVAFLTWLITHRKSPQAAQMGLSPSERTDYSLPALYKVVIMSAYLAGKWWLVLAVFVVTVAYFLPETSVYCVYCDDPGWLQITIRGLLTVLMAGIGILVLLVLAILLIVSTKRSDKTLIVRLLQAYQLHGSLFQANGLKAYLIKRFGVEADYYGKPHIDDVVKLSLLDRLRGTRQAIERKQVGHYSDPKKREPIDVGIVVATVSDAELKLVERNTGLIDGLLAATSVTPLFPPAEIIKGDLCIDGTNVANEPSWPLLGRLRRRINPAAPVVHIYSVTPSPISKGKLGTDPDKPEGYLNLIDVAWRALRLRRLRDATLERRLIELVTQSLPPRGAKVGSYVRAWVTPIELETDRSLNAEILGASEKEDRRKRIAKTIADGCRASLEVMIADLIEAAARGADNTVARRTVACREAVETHFKMRQSRCQLPHIDFPGQHQQGPGLREICEYCSLRPASEVSPEEENRNNSDLVSDFSDEEGQSQLLRARDWEMLGPAWPHEREYEPDSDYEFDNGLLKKDPRFKEKDRERDEANGGHGPTGKIQWPSRRGDDMGQKEATVARPTVSFLFSGGVFRGVYQVGVLNALSEIGLQPDVIAGASVGSITAAMAIETFHLPRGDNRLGNLARLAALYLVADRLILTDRFADFVRNFTLRAAATRLSVRQLDHLFRKYDYPGFREFDRTARDVLAGIERLLYINPYQLNELVRAARNGDSKTVLGELGERFQQWLNRMQVGDELLGAEALEMLIDEYVTPSIGSRHPVGPTFEDVLSAKGILFLATATNITEGQLEVIGRSPNENHLDGPMLKEGLLASSAFPAVFRPRWSWELYPGSPQKHQYIDGGVTDNLPLDAVAEFLADAAKLDLIERQPEAAPHLIVAGSLQVDAHTLTGAGLTELKESWPALFRRSRELGYNNKLDLYVQVEKDLQCIAQSTKDNAGAFAPLKIEVVAIKPQWLCGTFALHPMLGYRRNNQARSIAHGCASTLLRFAEIAKEDKQLDRNFLRGWTEEGVVPEVSKWADAFERNVALQGQVTAGTSDRCWLRPGEQCPFSKKSLDKAKPPLPAETIAELSVIHSECPKRETHLRPM